MFAATIAANAVAITADPMRIHRRHPSIAASPYSVRAARCHTKVRHGLGLTIVLPDGEHWNEALPDDVLGDTAKEDMR